MSELKRTALYSLHLNLDAKIVAFAGYEMPVQYQQGIIKEHLHCREQAGFFDISHMGQFLITGPSVAEELETLVPSNIIELKTGRQRYTVLTNNNGGIVDDIIITRIESGFLVVVNAACKEKDFAHLTHHLSNQCEIKILQDRALLALQGPTSTQVMAQLSKQATNLSFMQCCSTQIANIECFISRCGYTGEDGFEISVDNIHAETIAQLLLDFSVVKPIGLGARDTLRLEAGLSLYGHELSESISPVEAGLKWTFRKDAANYLGSEIIQAQLNFCTGKKRVGLIVEGKAPVRENTELFDKQDQVGLITSGSFSPSLGKPIALALINRDHKETAYYAKVRNRTITLKTASLPFIPHRYQRS